MSEQIIKIAQVNDPILNNLVDTENKLNQLNQEVGLILQDYQAVNTTKPSFFNFDNPFFLLTLVGLIILVFALWFLKQELKHSKPKKIKSQPVKSPKVEIKTVPKIKEEKPEVKISKPKPDKKIIKSKGRKIKVVKIK
jgi:hypothetical protein